MFKKGTLSFRAICLCVATSIFSVLLLTDIIKVKEAIAAELTLPAVGSMVKLSEAYSLPTIKGIRFNESNPFNLEFIMEQGSEQQITNQDKAKLVRLFLAALTVPEDKLWVNLSPYEKDRVIDENVAKTEIGETLLSQDYILKQLSSSLTHPDTPVGRTYWDSKFNIQNSRSEDFNKIWISPGEISVYDDANTVFVSDVELEVQTEADYLAAKNNQTIDADMNSDLLRDLIVPQIKEDVNTGRNFAELRQMISSIVVAQWFKKKFANSLYSFYFNAEKMKGVDVADASLKEKVFNRYVEAFNKGAYNMTKKERDNTTGRLVKRAYFSGGISSAIVDKKVNLLAHNQLMHIQGNSQYDLTKLQMLANLKNGKTSQILSSALVGSETNDHGVKEVVKKSTHRKQKFDFSDFGEFKRDLTVDELVSELNNFESEFSIFEESASAITDPLLREEIQSSCSAVNDELTHLRLFIFSNPLTITDAFLASAGLGLMLNGLYRVVETMREMVINFGVRDTQNIDPGIQVIAGLVLVMAIGIKIAIKTNKTDQFVDGLVKRAKSTDQLLQIFFLSSQELKTHNVRKYIEDNKHREIVKPIYDYIKRHKINDDRLTSKTTWQRIIEDFKSKKALSSAIEKLQESDGYTKLTEEELAQFPDSTEELKVLIDDYLKIEDKESVNAKLAAKNIVSELNNLANSAISAKVVGTVVVLLSILGAGLWNEKSKANEEIEAAKMQYEAKMLEYRQERDDFFAKDYYGYLDNFIEMKSYNDLSKAIIGLDYYDNQDRSKFIEIELQLLKILKDFNARYITKDENPDTLRGARSSEIKNIIDFFTTLNKSMPNDIGDYNSIIKDLLKGTDYKLVVKAINTLNVSSQTKFGRNNGLPLLRERLEKIHSDLDKVIDLQNIPDVYFEIEAVIEFIKAYQLEEIQDILEDTQKHVADLDKMIKDQKQLAQKTGDKSKLESLELIEVAASAISEYFEAALLNFPDQMEDATVALQARKFNATTVYAIDLFLVVAGIAITALGANELGSSVLSLAVGFIACSYLFARDVNMSKNKVRNLRANILKHTENLLVDMKSIEDIAVVTFLAASFKDNDLLEAVQQTVSEIDAKGVEIRAIKDIVKNTKHQDLTNLELFEDYLQRKLSRNPNDTLYSRLKAVSDKVNISSALSPKEIVAAKEAAISAMYKDDSETFKTEFKKIFDTAMRDDLSDEQKHVLHEVLGDSAAELTIPYGLLFDQLAKPFVEKFQNMKKESIIDEDKATSGSAISRVDSYKNVALDAIEENDYNRFRINLFRLQKIAIDNSTYSAQRKKAKTAIDKLRVKNNNFVEKALKELSEIPKDRYVTVFSLYNKQDEIEDTFKRNGTNDTNAMYHYIDRIRHFHKPLLLADGTNLYDGKRSKAVYRAAKEVLFELDRKYPQLKAKRDAEKERQIQTKPEVTAEMYLKRVQDALDHENEELTVRLETPLSNFTYEPESNSREYKYIAETKKATDAVINYNEYGERLNTYLVRIKRTSSLPMLDIDLELDDKVIANSSIDSEIVEMLKQEVKSYGFNPELEKIVIEELEASSEEMQEMLMKFLEDGDVERIKEKINSDFKDIEFKFFALGNSGPAIRACSALNAKIQSELDDLTDLINKNNEIIKSKKNLYKLWARRVVFLSLIPMSIFTVVAKSYGKGDVLSINIGLGFIISLVLNTVKSHYVKENIPLSEDKKYDLNVKFTEFLNNNVESPEDLAVVAVLLSAFEQEDLYSTFRETYPGLRLNGVEFDAMKLTIAKSSDKKLSNPETYTGLINPELKEQLKVVVDQIKKSASSTMKSERFKMQMKDADKAANINLWVRVLSLLALMAIMFGPKALSEQSDSKPTTNEIITEMDLSQAQNGGIDLKGMLDGVEVSASSSAIRFSPEIAAQISGMTFKFIGKPKLMPLKAIIVSPSI